MEKKINEPWYERLVSEQVALKDKLMKLIDFMNSEKFYSLSDNTKQVLKNQKIAMELYLSVLNMRVYEDIDKIAVPDLGLLGMVGAVFGRDFRNTLDVKPNKQITV